MPVDKEELAFKALKKLKKKHASEQISREDSESEVEESEKKRKFDVKLRQVSLEDVCTDGFEAQSDDTFLRFVILNIRKAHLKYVKTFYVGKQSKWSGTPNQNYDRIVTAADLSNDKGMCFCFLYSTQRESDFKLMRFKMSNCGVGEIGEVLEPIFTKKTLGNSDVPILEHKKPLIHVPNIAELLRDLPEMKFVEDSLPNCGTHFFLFKKVHLHVQNAIVEDPICTGYMCDRQEERKVEGTPCGCLVQSDRCNVVLSCTLFVSTKEGEQLFICKNFRSWVFTKLLFGTSLSDLATKADYNDGEAFYEVRNHLSLLVDYVNANGGWSIVGWFRIGMLQDAGDVSQDLPRTQTELIGAETVIPHISRICPSEVEVTELHSFQLKRKGASAATVARVEGSSKEEETQKEVRGRCQNCCRYNVGITYEPIKKFALRRKLCCIGHPRSDYVWICQECVITLLRGNRAMNWVSIWPSYYWKLMMQNLQYITEIWRWIPQNWRCMWIGGMTGCSSVSEEYPSSYFFDASDERRLLQEDLASMTLIRLKDTLNRHPYTSVKCPWGCDEFLEVCYFLPLYGFLSTYLVEKYPDIQLPICTDTIVYGKGKRFNAKKSLVGIRPDYLTSENFMLDNPMWPIRPSLCFIPECGPMVLVCKRHRNGASKAYIHVPAHPLSSNLPSINAPKLAHATLCPRTVQTMKLHKYSNTYQLVNTEGFFSGIDSCYITENSHFDTNLSPISQSDEILFLNLRPDMKARLKYLMESQQFPYSVGEEKLKTLLDVFPNVENFVVKSLQGSSYVSLFDTLLLEKAMQSSSCSGESIELPWVPFIVTSHPSNYSYGSPLLCPTKLCNKKDYRLLWILHCLLLNNNILWNLFTDYSISTEQDNWAGWLLKYLSRTMFWKKHKHSFSRYSDKKSIHEVMQIMNAGFEAFTWLLTLISLLQPMKGIAALDLNTMSETSIEEFLLYQNDASTKAILLFSPAFSSNNTVDTTDHMQSSLTDDDLSKDEIFDFSQESFLYWYMNNVIPMRRNSTLSDSNDAVSNSFRLPLQVHLQDGVFELCAAIKSEEDMTPNPQWDAYIKVRRIFHEDFNVFWNVKRNIKPYLSMEDQHLNIHDFNVVCYVKRPNLTDIQQNYLLSMGNQCLVKCPVHHKHLVSSAYGTGERCSYCGPMNKICNLSSTCRCPFRFCSFCLCKKHLQVESTCNEAEESVLSEKVQELDEGGFTDIFDVFDGSKSYSSEVSNENDGLFPIFLATDALDNIDSICSSVEDSIEDEEFLQDSVGSADKIISEVDENDDASNALSCNTEDETDSILSLVLPTSNPSQRLHYLKEPIASSIPLTVLFNKHLHVLIRRNYELKASKKMKGFLERIVATVENDTVPLLFPEGMLFPHIFYHQRLDGSIDGCIPAPLWNSNRVVHSYGFASIVDQMRARITNSALRCSTEPSYLFFAFDAISNSLCHEDYPQLILARGYEHMLRDASIHGFEAEDSFKCHKDMIDPRQSVQELSAFLREHDPTYFYTHTCNVHEHFGVAPLQRWVDSQILELRNNTTLSDVEFQQMEQSYHQRLVVPLTRSWFRAGNYFLQYICKSPEEPLGPIAYFWYKWEDNDKVAALQHLHAILVSLENKSNPEDLRRIQNRIICSSRKAIDPAILQPLFEEGLLQNTEESVQHYYQSVKIIQEHGKCSSHNYSCHRRTGLKPHETKCRVPHYGKENPSPNIHTYVHINPNHSSLARQILQDCHLLSTKTTDSGVLKDVYLNSMLDNGKYYYPATTDEQLSPFNPRLFASHFSSDCLLICNRAMSSRYLAKYNTLVDKSLEVVVHPGKEYGELVTQLPYAHNTKITSSRFYEQQLQDRDAEHSSTTGRKVGLPQAIALMLQIPQIYTNATFIHIPTTPLEQRAGILIKPLPPPSITDPFPHYVPLNMGDNIPTITYREIHSFPQERTFTEIEKIIISDTLSCPDSIDKITIFSIRPPELRFVQNVQQYYRWFIHEPSSNINPLLLMDEDFFKCAWVNGVGHHIKVRTTAIPYILQDVSCPTPMGLLLYSLLHNDQCQFFPLTQHNLMKEIFLDTATINEVDLPIIVLPPVKPTQTNRFLIHLLLSLGSYSNEGQLFNTRTIIESFRNAQLLLDDTSGTLPTMNDVYHITRRYIAEQLFFIPAGTKTFDHYTVAAFQAIKMALLQSSIMSFDIPSYLYTSLVTAADQRCIDFQQELRHHLIETLQSESNAPDATMLHNATKTSPLPWHPHITQLPDQSDASYSEHIRTSDILKSAIDSYIAGGSTSPSSIIIIGGPGTGKTFQMKQACLYALSQGLNVLTSALMSERAIILGCRHLHYLFRIPGYKFSSIHRLTDDIIKNLNQDPEFCYTLRTNDLFCLDEGEFLSAELFNVLDNVLRYIRDKNTFFGGMQVITTMDVQQLPPIEGHPCFMSSIILTSFRMVTLNEYVRSRTDIRLQRVISLIRKLQPLTQVEVNEFIHLISSCCTHVNDWDNELITSDTIRILGTRKGVHTAEITYYNNIQREGLTIVSRTSEDYENLKTSHGTWRLASRKVINSLNKLVREPELLLLHEGLLVELTCNNGTKWSNGQIAIIANLPDQETLNNWKPFPILLAPVGVHSLPYDSPTVNDLLQSGWKSVFIKLSPERTHHCFGGMFAKRRQYGIRPIAATTIHKAMGNDYDKIVSCVIDDGLSGFRLWERAQVLVLISRVHQMQDIIFVGDKELTAQKLLEIISIIPKYALYIDYIITCLTQTEGCEASPIINLSSTLPFHLNAIECPKPDEILKGYCYLIISIPQPQVTYIGQTLDLHRRLHQHNSGWSHHWTENMSFRPWTYMAYIVGFQKHSQRKHFESMWQHLVQLSFPNQTAKPLQVLHVATVAVSKYYEEYNITSDVGKLRIIQILSLETKKEVSLLK